MVKGHSALGKSSTVLISLVILFGAVAGFSSLRPGPEAATIVRTVTVTAPGQERTVTVTTTAVTEKVAIPMDPRDYISNREKQLYEAAKKEGKVVFYSVMDIGSMELIKKAFEAKYPGVTVENIRGTTGELLQRFLGEARTGTHLADVYNTLWSSIDVILREKLAASYISPESLIYPPELRSDLWTAYHYQPQTIVYNTNLVKGSDIPDDYWDVLDPKFKGKITIHDPTTRPYTILAMKEKVIGKERWPEFVRGLCRQQGKILQSMGAHISQLVSGETSISIWLFLGTTIDNIKKGAPIEFVRRGTLIADIAGQILYKNAPHPNAGKLFYDYLLSKEGSTILAEKGAYVQLRPEVPQVVGLNVGVGIPVEGKDIRVPSPYTVEDAEAIVKEWKELFRC